MDWKTIQIISSSGMQWKGKLEWVAWAHSLTTQMQHSMSAMCSLLAERLTVGADGKASINGFRGSNLPLAFTSTMQKPL